MRAALFVTCMVDLFAPEVGDATVAVLRAGGCDVTVPRGQVCCGQPAWNSGFADDAAAVARTSLAALSADDAEVIVVPAGSCATMIRVFWPELFEVVGDHEAAAQARALAGRTRELTELLATLPMPPLAATEAMSVAYHHSCHMLRELRVEQQPEQLLDAVGGIERVDWSAGQRCCGFGGLFSCKLPETSVAMADDKLGTLAEEAPGAILVGADTSCLMQMRTRAEHEGNPIVTRHIAEVLAAALP